ncbi:MAG: MarR family transcriptional regulator [Anaerolineae bacterium]
MTPMLQPSISAQALAAELQQVMLQASSLARRHLMDVLTDFNLTVPQYYALVVVRRSAEGCSMSDLAEATHQVPATMTGIVERLAERGLVARRRDAADRRSRRVFLTDAGERLLAEIDHIRHTHMAAVLEQFPPDDRQALLGLMTRYLHALEAVAETETQG